MAASLPAWPAPTTITSYSYWLSCIFSFSRPSVHFILGAVLGVAIGLGDPPTCPDGWKLAALGKPCGQRISLGRSAETTKILAGRFSGEFAKVDKTLRSKGLRQEDQP
jgi:hypothetical protein